MTKPQNDVLESRMSRNFNEIDIHRVSSEPGKFPLRRCIWLLVLVVIDGYKALGFWDATRSILEGFKR